MDMERYEFLPHERRWHSSRDWIILHLICSNLELHQYLSQYPDINIIDTYVSQCSKRYRILPHKIKGHMSHDWIRSKIMMISKDSTSTMLTTSMTDMNIKRELRIVTIFSTSKQLTFWMPEWTRTQHIMKIHKQGTCGMEDHMNVQYRYHWTCTASESSKHSKTWKTQGDQWN